MSILNFFAHLDMLIECPVHLSVKVWVFMMIPHWMGWLVPNGQAQ